MIVVLVDDLNCRAQNTDAPTNIMNKVSQVRS